MTFTALRPSSSLHRQLQRCQLITSTTLRPLYQKTFFGSFHLEYRISQATPKRPDSCVYFTFSTRSLKCSPSGFSNHSSSLSVAEVEELIHSCKDCRLQSVRKAKGAKQRGGKLP